MPLSIAEAACRVTVSRGSGQDSSQGDHLSYQPNKRCDTARTPSLGPQRPNPEEGSVLDPARHALPPSRPWIGAVGHTQNEASFAGEDRRHFVMNACAIKHHGGI